MFATLTDIYIRFGRENVLGVANFDALDLLDSDSVSLVESRIEYFLEQTFEFICDALRQGAYEVDAIEEPYPKTLVNLNSELVYIRLYRARNSQDESTPDAYRLLEEECTNLIRRIHGRAVRFDKRVSQAVSIPGNVDAPLLGGSTKKPCTIPRPPSGTENAQDAVDRHNIATESHEDLRKMIEQIEKCKCTPMTSEEVIEMFNKIFLTP